MEDAVAAVVIGRNEGERLVRCLASVKALVPRLVYVDSGSTDGSVAVAGAAGADVVTLDADTPFTAARARNAGVAALRANGDPPRYVQFVDGDCEVDPGWIPAARAFLDGEVGAAVACGRRRERFPEASIYNRLVDMEWNTPIGEARACGGDSLVRLAAFDTVGGFDGSLIAGEEPDLCFRLRRAGWSVWRLDREMTRHDAALTRFVQWWRRAVRGGWAFAEGAARHGDSPERYNRRQTRSVLVWGGAAPAGVAALLLASTLPGVGGYAVAGAAIGVAALAAMALRTAAGRRRRFGDPWPDALAYGAFTMLGKIPQVLGVLRYLASRRATGPARIIEYKT